MRVLYHGNAQKSTSGGKIRERPLFDHARKSFLISSAQQKRFVFRIRKESAFHDHGGEKV